MAPVLANKAPFLNQWTTPLDFGKSYRGKRIFGTNKTWRGLFSGAVLGSVIGLLIFPHIDLYLDRGNYLLLGAAIALGALVGDAIESFFKRQVGIASGHSWFPFDQTDYIIGGILFSLPFVRLEIASYITIFAVFFGLHLLVSYIGFRIGLKSKPI